MWPVVITVTVIFLAVCSVFALLCRRDHSTMKKALREGSLSPEKALEAILLSENSLRSLAAIFHDADHSWLSTSLRMKDEANSLKYRRIKLARRFLRAVDDNFSRMLVIHEFLSVSRPRSEADRISEMAFRFRLKILCSRLLLPLNYLRYHLSPLGTLLGYLDTASGIVRDQLKAETIAA